MTLRAEPTGSVQTWATVERDALAPRPGEPRGLTAMPDSGVTATTDRPASVGRTWGWAVVEIRRDGTWGQPRVVEASGPAEAAASAAEADARDANQLPELAPMLHAHLGSLHLSNGDLHQAVRALLRGTGVRAPVPMRTVCLGRLAHVEAIQGDLRRASRHAAQVSISGPMTVGTGAEHAHLAKAWISLERGNFAETRRRLDVPAGSTQPDPEPWITTSRLLVEARLLVATGQPDAATRLLAAGREPAGGQTPDWLADLVTIARAEALLASGEAQRALATLTPLPERAIAEATVVAAAARHDVGDVRGAQAILSRAVMGLESAPLALQIEAWLLESRLAADRGKHERARLLMDRALRAATAEQMRRPLLLDWRWLRGFVDRDPALLRSHRGFLATCHVDDPALLRRRTVGADAEQLLGAALTEREGQVLDLLAQMYSTEEIATALYVSSNTVKTHLKGIFGKLCVNRRVDAVRRGRQLGLC